MAMFKTKQPKGWAAKEAGRAAEHAAKQVKREAQRREAFRKSPVGRATAAFDRGDHLFQYSHDVMSQEAVIVPMAGSKTNTTSNDASAVLNAVCRQGWELVNGSFLFVVEGEQSRDKLMSSGQNVAVKGTTVGYYLFRRCEDNRTARPEDMNADDGVGA